MSSMTPKQAREYIDRWKLVEEAELAELRLLAIETKLQQLAVLMASRSLFGDDLNREAHARDVGGRWAQIRQALRA